MQRCSCNMPSSLGEYHYYHHFKLCRDVCVTCQVVPCSDNHRRNGTFWLLEAGKEEEVKTMIFPLQEE